MSDPRRKIGDSRLLVVAPPSRVGSAASAAVALVVGALAAATLAFVTCRIPPPPDFDDAGPPDLDAAVPASVDASAVADDAGDAGAGPQAGDPCESSVQCGVPAMICCAGVCLPPARCM